MRILEMLQDGKLNVEEAENLLSALGEDDSVNFNTDQRKTREDDSKAKKRHLRIIVNEDGKEKVNLALPLGIAKSLLNFIPQSAKAKISENDINLDALSQTLDNLSEEKEILRVEDDNETVVIRVE